MYSNNGTKYASRWYTKAETNDYYSSLNTTVVLAKSHVPVKHKQLAANYVLIRKIFGFCSAAIPITNADRAILSRHGYSTLENTSVAQINRQIEQLKNWSNSGDILLNVYANELFEIRIKELKYLRLTMSSERSVEFKDGYKALEKYIIYIAK